MKFDRALSWGLGATLLGAAGCAGVPRAPVPNFPLTLLGIEAHADGKILRGGPDVAILVPGEFAVTAEVNRPVYVYIAHQSRASTVILYPSPGTSSQVLPGASIRIPASGNWIQLGELADGDYLCIATRSRPTDSPVGLCDAGRTQLRWSRDKGDYKPAQAPPPPPPPVTTPPPPPPPSQSTRGQN